MKLEEAEAIVLFVKDHDTRFTAAVSGEGDKCRVQMTQPDGTVLDPVGSREEYHQRFIAAHDPGPTIRQAWERWKP